jgi:pyruvate dehydrogenase E2 component (dihydrolipoamide acetyltransferase)
VAVEDGLVVPVLKFTDAMSLSQIGGSVRDLAGRAKNKNYCLQKWKEVLYCF